MIVPPHPPNPSRPSCFVKGFGKYTIGDVVQFINFQDVNVTDNTREDSVRGTVLAPSFGSLTANPAIDMDENLKIAIAGTTKLISDIPSENRTWQAILALMSQNIYLEPMSDGEVSKLESFIMPPRTRYLKFSRSRDDDVARVRQVSKWINQYIEDEDVKETAKINVDELCDLVAQTGADVSGFRSLIAKTESHHKTQVDIGIIRYPDIDHPYFKIFRIQFVAWSKCDRFLILHVDSNGIGGDYRVRRYKPRDSVINQMSERSRRIAVKQAEADFEKLGLAAQDAKSEQ